MEIKKIFSAVLSVVFCVSTFGTAAAAVPDTVQGKLAAVETTMYGEEQTGALMTRINTLEKDYAGSHPKGSMMSRVDSLYSMMFDNSVEPSLQAKMNALEWTIMHQVSRDSIQARTAVMENAMNGNTASGTYKSRIDKLATYAFGTTNIPLTQVTVPANTLVKIALVTPINAKTMKAGDTVQYTVAEDVLQDGMLIFAKGAPGSGVVKKVEQASNFGRDAKIDIDFQTATAMDGTSVDMTLGAEAQEKMETMAMAAGASIAGMIVLGPIGIIGGAFVKGKNIDLPAGTELYIQTKADTVLYGIPTTEAM